MNAPVTPILAGGETRERPPDTDAPCETAAPPRHLPASKRASGMETADGYHGTIATSGRHRIVRCNDNLQWIVQRRKAHGGDRSWRAIAYVCNESWLCVVLERPSLGIPPEDTAVILAQWEARGPGNRK